MSLARPFLQKTLGIARPALNNKVLVVARAVQIMPVMNKGSQAHQQHPKKPPSALAQLRKKTGYSLSFCKKALAENDQDLAKAKAWLEEQAQAQGWNKANKLEGRNTTQGLIGLQVTQCGSAAAMVELNSETDFVARNKQFHILLNAIVDVCLSKAKSAKATENQAVVVETLGKAELAEVQTPDGKTLADLVALNIGQIGENLILRRAILFKVNPEGVTDPSVEQVKLSALTHPSANIHSGDSVAYGRFGSILAYVQDKRIEPVLPEGQTIESLARQICQHVIGMNPTSVGDVTVNKAEELQQAAADASENKEKIEEPKGEGVQADEDWSQYQDQSLIVNNSTELVHQPFLTNSSVAVREVILEAGLDIKNFSRFEVGQTEE